MTAGRYTAIATLLVAAFDQGCGYQRTMTFPSPSGRAAIEIWQTRFANEWGTRVALVTGQRRTDLFENRREALVYFVHVYWSPDETKVGILATGANIWNVSFDVDTGKAISFDQVREGFAESIRKTYNVPRGEDPIAWASRADAQVEFFRLHPEIKVTYR